MSEDDFDFLTVTRAFLRGDSRPLAEWVLTRDMTMEQRKFVAQALLGDVEKLDGRTVKPLTERIEKDYVRLIALHSLLHILGEAEMWGRDAKIARKLADKYRYSDADSVRRAISRYKMKMRNPDKKKITVLKMQPGDE